MKCIILLYIVFISANNGITYAHESNQNQIILIIAYETMHFINNNNKMQAFIE